MGFHANRIVVAIFTTALGFLSFGTVAHSQTAQETIRTPRLDVAYKIDPTLASDAALSWDDFSTVEPSADALASQLSIADLAEFTAASAPNAALMSGYAVAQQGRLDLALAQMTLAVQAYPDDAELRTERMNTAVIAGNAQIALADALFIIADTKRKQAQHELDMSQYQLDLADWEARQPADEASELANETEKEIEAEIEEETVDEDPKPREPQAPRATPLADIVALSVLAREEDWDSIARLEFIDLGEPIFNFVAQGLWTFATLDQGEQSQALLRVDQTFSVGGFETQKQLLLGLVLTNLGDPESAITGLAYALNNSELGSQRAAIWAYRASIAAGNQDAAQTVLSNLGSNATRSYQLYDLLQIELAASQAPPTKREMVVELMMQLTWFFVNRENQQLAQTMGDLAWLMDGGDQRGSAQLTLMRLGLNAENARAKFAQYQVADFDSVPTASMLQISEQTSVLLRQGLYGEALAYLDSQQSNDLRLLPLRAAALSAAHRYSDAIATYQQWEDETGELGIIRADWLTYFQWATAHFWHGDLELMETRINKALELNPNNPFATNFLAYSWVDKGVKLDESLEMLLKADEISPGRSSIVDSIGWAYYRLGDFDTAVEFLERAWNLESSSWEIADHLGDVYLALDRPNEAVWFWQRASNLDDVPDARLAQIQAKIEDNSAGETAL